MRIDNLREELTHERARVGATVTWEDCNQPTSDVFFETDAAFADSLTCNPHAFLVGCLISAMHHGEKRIFIDEEICPELRDGLITAMSWMRHWYYEPRRDLVRIEAKTRSRNMIPGKPERAGFFFSGGIDSYATLRLNRLNFPEEHPGSIKDGLIVFGLHREEPDNFKKVLDLALEIAHKAGVTPIPVYTNIVSLGHGWEFWGDEGEGAALSAVAHAFTKRLSVVSIASSFNIPLLHPHGSHPVLDPTYSSSDLRIRHDGISLSRFMKVKLVADWDIALQNIRVCNITKSIRPDMLNCGQCEKCVRTMLSLLALGALRRTQAFPVNDVSAELLQSAVYMDKTTCPFYGELLKPLAEAGRHDLVTVIDKKIAQYHRYEKIQRLSQHLKQLDEKYLNGELIKFKRLLFPKTHSMTVSENEFHGMVP